MHPKPESTLAIILGASTFPAWPELGATASFGQSAREFAQYLLDSSGFGLSKSNLLNLFECVDPVQNQDEKVKSFLKERTKKLSDSRIRPTDLIVYYVGHGGFYAPGDHYFLTLSTTSKDSEAISGYPMQALAKTLKTNAPHLRRYLILDCCFSAAAIGHFQSNGALQVARQQTMDVLPKKGTALLCAAGPHVPAKAPDGEIYTMFSGALLDVLTKGLPDFPERLTLADVGEATKLRIHDRFEDSAVRPEVHSPDQEDGNLALLPLFPNPRLRVTDLSKNVARLDLVVSEIVNAQRALQKSYSSIQERLDRLALEENASVERRSTPDGISAGPGIGEPIERPIEMARAAGLTNSEWSGLPARIKNEIMVYTRRARTSRLWLYASLGIAMTTWMCSLLSAYFPFFPVGPSSPATSKPQSELPYFAKLSSDVMIAICGALCLAAVISKVISSRIEVIEMSARREDERKEETYDRYDIVVSARAFRWLNVFGLEIGKLSYATSQLVYLITFIGTLGIRMLRYYYESR